MQNRKLKTVFVGMLLITSIGISNCVYAEVKTDIKKMQKDIDSLQKTQKKMALTLDKLQQEKLSLADEYHNFNANKTSRGTRYYE